MDYPENNTNYKDFSNEDIDISGNLYYEYEYNKLEKERTLLDRNSYYYLEWLQYQQDIAYILMIVYYILWVTTVITLVYYKQNNFTNIITLVVMLIFPYLIYHYIIINILHVSDLLLDYIPDDTLLYSDIN